MDRIESQLVGAEDLQIRQTVDQKYELLVNTMFECLQQMAKMGGEQAGASAEDKDQLNYHVVLIGTSLFSRQRSDADSVCREYAPLRDC